MPALVLIAMIALAATAPRFGVDSRPDFTGRPGLGNRSS